MDEQSLLNALALGEERDWEFKSAKGGLPGSLWETYSAMANTDGGVVALGVERIGEHHHVGGLGDVAQLKKSFWDTVNNRGKVSINLLTDEDVQTRMVGSKAVLIIRVPRASRQQRPVFVGQNPLTGTYRRNYEGDYHCTEQEVGRMLADRVDDSTDSRILENFTLEDLDQTTLNQYRQRFSTRSPNHPWLAEDVKGFLVKLGVWRLDRQTGKDGVTVAGLLMFGQTRAILDPLGVPEFHVDYREKLSDDPQVRWTDRITWDGTWEANVFQFYQRVLPKLTADLKTPFQLERDLFRKDETIVHEAIREALVNALIHADYRGQGGIVIEKYRHAFELSNPGTLLVSREQLLRGGVSECRNKSLQTMFLMIGSGEKAGSGLDKIRQGWAAQQWMRPRIFETYRPDRVGLSLPMVSMLPEDSQERLRSQFGVRMDTLGPVELQALITADVEGCVSNARMQEVTTEHPADLTRILQGLANQGFLRQRGQKRGTLYLLPGRDSIHSAMSSEKLTGDSIHKRGTPYIAPGDSIHKTRDLASLTLEERRKLEVIAAASQADTRLRTEEMRHLILSICDGVYLTAVELGQLLRRNPVGLRTRFLGKMVAEGLLLRKYPDEPNRPDQAYTTRTERRAGGA